MYTSPTTAAHVLADLDGRIACVLDGGPCPVGVESTVVDLTTDPPQLLRAGGVPVEALRDVLPELLLPEGQMTLPSDPAEPARAPGQLERHYAPTTPLTVFDGTGPLAISALLAEGYAALTQGERVAALVPDEEADALRDAGIIVVPLGPQNDLAEIAHRFYAALRQADALGVDRLLAHTFGEAGLGLALRDRLRRAAGGQLRPVE
jgi:L-threonylcarbamoyladenylate synthase